MGVYELLDKIRRRPGMYIGYHSPTHLHSFLSGFLMGTGSALKTSETPHFNEFQDWVAGKFNYYESTSGWAYMIEDQREDKEEALHLFFELLDEFRGIVHETLKVVEYTSEYCILDTGYSGHSREQKVYGSMGALPRSRPDKLIIRKIYAEGWYSLIALNSKGEILQLKNSDSLDIIFTWGRNIYGVREEDWMDGPA